MIVKLLPVCLVFLPAASTVFAGELDWSAKAPRDEIRPVFQQHEDGGLVIKADDREGLNGWWTATLPVEGRQHVRFSVRRQTSGMSDAEIRRAAVVRLVWKNARGGPVIVTSPRIRPIVPVRNRGRNRSFRRHQYDSRLDDRLAGLSRSHNGKASENRTAFPLGAAQVTGCVEGCPPGAGRRAGTTAGEAGHDSSATARRKDARG